MIRSFSKPGSRSSHGEGMAQRPSRLVRGKSEPEPGFLDSYYLLSV